MNQKLFCPHCSAAYENTAEFCQNCGGAVPDAKWPRPEDLPKRMADATEATEESGLAQRDAETDDDHLTIVS
jgi:hypothetical protein